MSILSDRLKELRDEKQESQDNIAGLLKITRTSYCKYETGRPDPPIEALIVLADYFDVTVDYLIGRTDERCYPENISQEEEKLLHTYRVSDSDGRKVFDDHCCNILKYRFSEEEEKLILDYRKANKSGQAAIGEFAEFMASKSSSGNGEEELYRI